MGIVWECVRMNCEGGDVYVCLSSVGDDECVMMTCAGEQCG